MITDWMAATNSFGNGPLIAVTAAPLIQMGDCLARVSWTKLPAMPMHPRKAATVLLLTALTISLD